MGTLLTAACLFAVPFTAAAQEQVDSAQMRLLERLRRLSRPPGYDSILFVQDSIARELAQGGRRPGAGGADSTLAAILAMPGFALTEYDGGRADFAAADRILVLQAEEGSRARVNRGGMEVQADSSITFDEASNLVRAKGASTFTPPEGDMVESSGLVYDLGAGRGSALEAKSTYEQMGGQWNVRGDMPFASPDSSFMSHARFTSCDLEVPHYHFETDEIKIVGNSVLVARPVRLYFADVPVAWLPFIAQSLSQGRASGLLTPRFSVNDIVRNSTGYRRRISNLGFYWAMSDYSDAIMAVDWFSDNFVALTSSVRYRFNQQFLDGSLNFRHYWRASGQTELGLDTRHSWEIDERTQLRVSGRFASSTDFVRQNSFNPAEVTQSIDSEGGLNRRFDWGSISLSANRKEYLSDDRVELTLPSANLSLSTITLFRAPANRARLWNNMTWGGSASLNRRKSDRAQGEVFDPSEVDREKTTGSVRSSLSLGNLSFSQNAELQESKELDIPEAYLLLGDSADPAELVTGAPARSITDQTVSWGMSLGYQQQLIGSTTLTPSLTLSGSMFQSDTSALASSFVSAPSRMSFGATLKTDVYGMFPGFSGYERIRHKFSPSFTYAWSPLVEPTELQRQVFRSRVLQPKNGLSVTLNNTIEAKKATPDSADSSTDDPLAEAAQPSGTPGEPRRLDRPEIVQLLGIRTSVVQYDFVEADSAGSFLAGFQTTRLTNQISSDFLQGLSVSVGHDLFKDSIREDDSLDRKFAPHLSSVNFSFSLSSRSGIFRLLGLGGGEGEAEQAAEEEEEPEEDPFLGEGITDESSIVPRAGAPRRASPRSSRSSGDRSWQANLTYSLQRPRSEAARASQMLTGTVRLRPTEQWDVSWRTAYDLERGGFNDHTIRLSRDIHRWQANFDFLQTATGNWQFRFEVSLTDNQDLKFDYQQRNLDAGRPSGFR
jgi:hypothetical protein